MTGMAATPTEVSAALDRYTKPAGLVQTLPDGRLQCLACAHLCKLAEGKRGICKVRVNQAGTLLAPWGYVAGLQADPVEKKPFYHLLPGSLALTFGMLGCNFHCDNCQNWFTSQMLRDPASDDALGAIRRVDAPGVLATARRVGARLLVSSYNEPFITTEWAAELFDTAKAGGLRTAFVSNGYGSAQALRMLAPRLDALKIDLKTMDPAGYRSLGGVLANVLATLDLALELGLWVEVVSLVIPGFNDSTEALYAMAQAVAARSPNLPWHVTAFTPQYRMQDAARTSQQALVKAAEIGQEAGLRYVYAGNLPGAVGEYEDTRCPGCGTAVVRRRGFELLGLALNDKGGCSHCGKSIPGVWG